MRNLIKRSCNTCFMMVAKSLQKPRGSQIDDRSVAKMPQQWMFRVGRSRQSTHHKKSDMPPKLRVDGVFWLSHMLKQGTAEPQSNSARFSRQSSNHDRVRAPARKAQSSRVLPLVAKDTGALPQTMSAQGVMPQQAPRTGFSKSSLRLRLE